MVVNSFRPKRASEDYARTYNESVDSGQASKKPRFDVRNPSALAPDAVEDDIILDADVIGSRGQQVRRNAVNIDGYDSDSDNEGFDARADAKARERKTRPMEEEENDMFADLEENLKDDDANEVEPSQKPGKKKAVRFLEEHEIEGQIQDSRSGGHVSVDFTVNGRALGKAKANSVEHQGVDGSSDSEVGDEIRAARSEELDEELGAGAKKTHAPKLDAFNMRNEQEEGRFDDQGNYVRKAADPDAIYDIWLEGLSKKDMRKAREAADKRDQERQKNDIEQDAISTTYVLKLLIPLLNRGETVLDALARLGKGRERKPKWQSKNKASKQQGNVLVTTSEGEDSVELERREAVEMITEAADLLLRRGQPEIYDTDRELLTRQFQRESGEAWEDVPTSGPGVTEDAGPVAKTWEYKWSDARDGGRVHGPYDGRTMVQWNEAGYFGAAVEFRQRNGTGVWSRVPDFT